MRVEHPISELNLSVRAINALDQIGAIVISQLTEVTREELMAVKGIGELTVNEIERALHQRGLSLAPSTGCK